MIQFGYFPDFADPTVLFWGEAEDLSRFAAFLREAASWTNGELSLADQPLFRPVNRISVVIARTSERLGLRRRRRGRSATFRWAMDEELTRRFADLIEAVARSTEPSHHYLDAPDGDDALVIVSKGEYDETFGGAEEEAVLAPR